MTGNREDYIKAIYELGGEKNRIGTKSIAKSLNISPPSVSEMIKKLVEEGYVEYKLYKGVKLTEKGAKEALRIKKRHLLWEVFLVEKLGYSWEDVHEEAEVLEHITSPKLEELLEKYLDYPKVCPHGTPLEDDSYIFNTTSLDSVKLGETAYIKRIVDEKEILKYVKAMDLKIGDNVKILEKDSHETIKIEKNGVIIDIEKNLSKKIFVG
ncbi:metal-dependent transcriptional regulator [Tissierella creatinophila]|uniref:Manganese transport regulator n=1 Tax=Tissierella creatinophila DSM 6911 TaxID=1123403 RepID=A0A1U7M796_TISCR|nr:metal-dependent transcriptional regulator [Tissierella creatinophila]OLS03161.1 iron-dependent repressor IdeR [Tissierella creatinophila DSM 6911]